jgi:hypothetical protein
MASTSETGHAKNVANFEHLISIVTALGAVYNPTKASLKLATLNTQFTSAKTDLQTVTTKSVTFNNNTNTRIIAFAPIRLLATRLVNAFASTDASFELVKDAKTINKKIQGSRVKGITQPTDPNMPAPTNISVSQQSYDQLVEHFNKLIELLKTEPSYAPNENELKIVTLTTILTSLKIANTSVTNSYTSITNARITRDKTLYKTKTGLVPIALDVKNYVKSIFGASSPEFKQINKVSFKSI